MQIKAEAVAKILGGRRVSGGFLCHCPVAAHGKGRGDVHPSLTIADGDRALLYTCHAGCVPRAIRAAIDRLNLHGEPLYASAQNSSSGRATPKTTSAHALALWRDAQVVSRTLAETYLRERGFGEPPPATIRFLPRYRYEPQGKYYACMIAAIQAPAREIVAVQLTFLHSGGRRKADVLETRRTVGPAGEGALRLAAVAEHIGVAEGFETAWAAQLMHKLPVWAALGTKRYLKLKLPREVTRVTIFADPDADGLLYAEKFRQANPVLGVEIVTPGAGADDFAKEFQTSRSAAKGSGRI